MGIATDTEAREVCVGQCTTWSVERRVIAMVTNAERDLDVGHRASFSELERRHVAPQLYGEKNKIRKTAEKNIRQIYMIDKTPWQIEPTANRNGGFFSKMKFKKKVKAHIYSMPLFNRENRVRGADL